MTTKESWKPVTIGGLTGILMGAGTMYAIQSVASENGVDPVANDMLQVANPADGLSFRQAFDAARAEVGPGGVFRWHGNIYNTYTEEEWKAMSEQEHEQFAQRVKPEVSPADIDTRQVVNVSPSVEGTEDDVQIADNQSEASPDEGDQVGSQYAYANPESHSSEDNQQVAASEPQATEDDDVRVIGFGHVEVAEGRYVAVEEVDINGQRVAIIDVDLDNVPDFAMSDLNHNQQLDEGEIIDLHTGESVAFTNEHDSSDDTLGEMAQDVSQPIDDGSDMLNITV